MGSRQIPLRSIDHSRRNVCGSGTGRTAQIALRAHRFVVSTIQQKDGDNHDHSSDHREEKADPAQVIALIHG